MAATNKLRQQQFQYQQQQDAANRQFRQEQADISNQLRQAQLGQQAENLQFRQEQADISNEFKRDQLALQAAGIDARTRAAQAKQYQDALNKRNKTVSEVYGAELSKSHESSLPFLRDAMDQAASKVDELLSQPNGEVLARKYMRNLFDSIDRYQDDAAWHDKEMEIGAMVDPNSPQSLAVAKQSKYYRPHVTLDEVSAMSNAARGGNVADMQLKFNEDGSFMILGTDAGGIEPTDISTHSWFNNPNIFKYTSVPVTVRDSQTIGRALGDEHKKALDDPGKVYDYVYNNVVRNGTLPMDFLGVQSTDPRYEIRVNAFQADKEDIMKTFGISDIEEVFSLYEFNPNNPQLQGEGNALKMRLERSIQDEAKRQAEASRYASDTEEDKEAIKIEESRQKTYGSGVVGEREVAQDSQLGLFEGEQEPLKTATFNLKNLETKAFENSPITIDNPQYAAFVEQIGGEQEAIALATQGIIRLPPKTLKYDVENITFVEGQPDLVEIGLSGTNERLYLNLNDLDDDAVRLKSAMSAAFAKAGLDFDGFRNAAQSMWEERPVGQPTESVAPTLTGSSR